MASQVIAGQGFWAAAATQRRVIGALIIRELHTRFGRDNIGYLWLLVEPMLLAVGVVLMHVGTHTVLPGGYAFVPFYITGYVAYMMFRSNVNRATSTIDPNKGLLYHRQVTLLDLVIARCILEFLATTATMFLMLGAVAALDLGPFPGRPLHLIGGMALMLWFTTGMSLVICAASEYFAVVERLVHPFTYLSLPVSGMAFMIGWLPDWARSFVQWIPLAQIVELVREGEFADFDSDYVNFPYLFGWCAGLTLIGLLWLRLARRRLHL